MALRGHRLAGVGDAHQPVAAVGTSAAARWCSCSGPGWSCGPASRWSGWWPAPLPRAPRPCWMPWRQLAGPGCSATRCTAPVRAVAGAGHAPGGHRPAGARQAADPTGDAPLRLALQLQPQAQPGAGGQRRPPAPECPARRGGAAGGGLGRLHRQRPAAPGPWGTRCPAPCSTARRRSCSAQRAATRRSWWPRRPDGRWGGIG